MSGAAGDVSGGAGARSAPWRNWSGELRFTPARLLRPGSEPELREAVRQAGARGWTIRPVGAGHSSAPLVCTDDLLVSPERLPTGVLHVDPDGGSAVLGAGTRLCDLEDDLRGHGLAMVNLGDVDTQALAGAVSTGTHGSGRGLGSLSTQLVGVRLVTATGEVEEWSDEREPDLMRAARVSLGALGVFTQLRLRLLPAFKARRREWGMHIDDCLAELDGLHHRHRNMDFYWYPRRDETKVRTVDAADDDPGPSHPPGTDCTEAEVGWSGGVLTKRRTLRFHEMEYALPAEAGRDCFAEIRQRMKARHRVRVGWRVLYRFVAADNNYLSPAYGRNTVTISLHQNSTLPYREFFADLEPVFQAYGGRPHWAKIHTMRGRALLDRYPGAETFLAIRQRLDPGGVFLNDHLRDLFDFAHETI